MKIILDNDDVQAVAEHLDRAAKAWRDDVIRYRNEKNTKMVDLFTLNAEEAEKLERLFDNADRIEITRD